MRYFLISIFICATITGINAQNDYFRFSSLPDLPAHQAYTVQPGLAGPYTGIDNDVLIVAGGANFPDKTPWEGGSKIYYNDIFILKGKEESQWERMEEKNSFCLGLWRGSLHTIWIALFWREYN